MDQEQTVHQPSSAATQLGFIGLGNQGRPIAERLAMAGHALGVWGRRAQSCEGMDHLGATIASSVEELAAKTDILFLCVLDDAAVQDVSQAALPVMKAGSLIVIASTIHPDTCRAIQADARPRGIAIIDAPVSGGSIAASEGRLTVMMGGKAEDCERLQPFLECFARLVVRLGELGAGQMAKLVNNSLMCANLAVAQSARDCATALGLDIDAVDRIFSASSGQSFAHDRLADLQDWRKFVHGAALLEKDIGLLDALCDSAGTNADGLIQPGRAFIDRFEQDKQTS